MKLRLPFELKIPVLYVNPPFHTDPGLLEEVSRSGGLGIVDCVTSEGFEISSDVPRGIRIGLNKLRSITISPDIKVVLIPLEDTDLMAALEPGALTESEIPVLVEVGTAEQASAAEKAGAAGLVAKGNEGPGWVSETNGLVLLQKILAITKLPVFLQGGVGFRTAAGAVAAGATGVVLDVQLLLTEGSGLAQPMKDFFRSLGLPASVTLAETTGTPLRVYSRIGTRIVRQLKKSEETLTPDDFVSYRNRLKAVLGAPITAPDSDEALLPISEDITSTAKLADEYKTAGAIVAEFGKRMFSDSFAWPFSEDSPLCRDHKTKFPIVQGPMAHVSDNPDFLAAVASGGALPFLAMGNMPGPIAREGVSLVREKTGGLFGVGLIGLEVNRKCYETHLEIMKDNPPPYAILAAGGPDLAKRIEDLGTACYLHCPSPSVLSEGLKTGLRRFVFEGCESGGHIGLLTSLNLWNANLAVLDEAASRGLALGEVTVLFAGGVATGRAAAFIAGMVADLTNKGLKAGLQMGTAYLTCEEAVSTCAITSTFHKLTLESDRTVIIGRTVNTRARAAGSPMASTIIEREHERLRNGVSLTERKELYEKDNLGSLRLASKGCAIDPNTATWDCPVFCDLPPEEQLNRGLYLMGQVVCLLDKPATIEALHNEIIQEGKRIFEARESVLEESKRPVEVVTLPEPIVEVEHEKEPIAVVGIGLRFPGSNSPKSFWDQIITGRSGIISVPEGRWADTDFFYHPDPKVPDKTYTKIGGFITDLAFDPLKYRIPPAVAQQMDRTQQMAVTCVADALADAGLSPDQLKGRRVAIILGNSMGGEKTDLYAERVNLPKVVSSLEKALESSGFKDEARKALVDEFRSNYLERLPEITEDSLPGELANVISGRVANVFNLEGPNFTVDAACASSMAAVMNAVSSLRDGIIDFAITGGVDAAMHPSSFVKFCKIGALSPDGSRPFDQAANGFVMGEGAGILVLKRLSDAVRDKDRIYGTILEVGSSSDGRGKGITAPNAAGQERAVKACLQAGGIDPTSIGLIEAHGTSTPVGDSTELTVLDRIFRAADMPKDSLGIGSVKSQIGHLKAAAGAAGMIKTLLSLYHRTLPPTINVRTPNPCIDWETSPLFLLTEPKPWEPREGYLRRAGVSAFGFGGTNFHVVFQEYFPGLQVISGKKQAEEVVEFIAPDWPRPATLQTEGEAWVLGAADPGDLSRKIESVLKELSPANATDIADRHRQEAGKFAVRCGFAADNADVAAKKLAMIREAAADPSKMPLLRTRGIHVAQGEPQRSKPGIAFLFPGQGSQYPFMLRDLCERFPVVAQTLKEADDVLVSLGLDPVTDSIFPSDANGETKNNGDAVKDTQLLQPMILTANTAILRLLARFNVRPVACAGHSLGEYAACVAAGVLAFRDAVEAVAVRGREMARVSIADPGLMMSIPADARVVEEILAEVDGYVVAANKNSPKQTVISGETAAVKKAGEIFKARGLEGIIIPVSAAFHSGVVAPAREPFMKTLEKLTMNPPSVPVLSNVTGDFYPVGPAAPGHIRDLLGKQFAAPVEWVKTLRRLYSEGIRIFLECGPKRVMTNLTLDTLSNDVLAMPTNHPKKGGIGQLMETLAALAAEGVPVDFSADCGATQEERPALRKERPELRIVRPTPETAPVQPVTAAAPSPELLDGLLDQELREIAAKKEFRRFLELQGEPIRGLIKSGFQTFVKNILPMEQTVRKVKSEGVDFKPPIISGVAVGLPSDVRFPFDRESLDDLIQGRNFIKKVSEEGRRDMLEKNVERLVKGPSGEVDLQVVDDISGVIKLAGFFNEEDVIEEYGLDERMVRAMDVTSRLAIAAGIEALRDAGIPLIRMTRTTSTGHELPDAWALPPTLRQETGVIFASAFPGVASVVDEVTRQTAARYGSGAKKRLIDFYTGLLQRIRDDRERERITKWFTDEFSSLDPGGPEEMYTFNRDFLLRVMTNGHGQFAQLIKAQGPNTHVNAACATTTQAIVLARDWIRTGQAKRVVVIAADDVAGRTLFPWIGSGFLALGAATTNGNVAEAALPFDDRRHGLILGSAAAGIVVESQDLVNQRGMEGIASVEAGAVANSGFHATRLDVEHISRVMGKMIGKWEEQSGNSREDLAKNIFFMSHETYSPKRGGSSAAEVRALRDTFGEKALRIPIANTKGFTGHTMGVGVEDIVALRCLQKRMLPPIPNLKQPDPEFADLNLSRGGACNADYTLRLAAGFGSQIVIALYKVQSREENRIADMHAHRNWLKEITGYADPVLAVEARTLRCAERSVEKTAVTKEISASHVEQIEASAPAAAKKVTANNEEIRAKILSLLSDKTGYPADMLDTGLDLEADLGIDTVKQAEFITEVRETFDIPRIDGLKIAEFPTIEHIINFVLQQTAQDVSTTAGRDMEADVQAQPATSEDATAVREKILELLSNKTGYPADMLDTELDLEADLGIDTVKQAEFITEVREIFNIPRIEGLKIAEFPTINHIINFVLERKRSQDQAAPAQAKGNEVDKTLAVQEEVRLYEARLVSLPPLEKTPLSDAEEIIVFGGPQEASKEVATALQASGYGNVACVTEPSLPDSAKEKRIGVVNLFPIENGPLSLRKTFELYLSCAQTFDNGPAFLITAVSEDGAYGFENPTEDADIPGAVAGATKAFAREYPETRVRLLDFHPELSLSDRAAIMTRSLTEEFPVETAVGINRELRTVRLVPVLEETDQPPLESGDVVLVTGGAKGITAECIRHLAGQQALTVVILARTALSSRSEQLMEFGSEQWEQEKLKIVERFKRDGKAPTPVMVEKELAALKGEAEVSRTLRGLRSMGSEVIYRAVDIRDADSVDRAIQDVAETCGRVDVVIHGAGIDVSRALRSKTLEQIENVLSVKIQGMRNMLASLERHGMPPRRIVGFGSVSGRFGNLAQVDYSAANDALSHMFRRADRELDAKVSVIDWAPWAEIGMAVRGSVQQTLEAAGIDFIPPKAGAEILAKELARSSGGVEVLAAGKLGPFASDAFSIPAEVAPAETLFAGQKGRVVALLPGEHVRVAVTLDPTHPTLDHHRIDRAAVFPGVGALDTMRTAASLLNPEANAASFENVHFKSPLKIFKNDPFEAEVEVIRIEAPAGCSAAYHARITSWFVDREGRRMGSPRTHHECRLVLGKTESIVAIEPVHWEESIWVSDRDVYESFFHGPAFKLLDHLIIEGSGRGIRFIYRDTEQRPTMFSSATPSGIEAIFQAAAGLALESRGVMALPTGVEQAIVHSDAMPYEGELISVRTTYEGPEGRMVFTFDGILRDRDRNPLVELKGVEMVELEAAAGFPGKVFEQTVQVAGIVKEMEKAPEAFISSVLHDEEAKEHTKKMTPKRAAEWLAGRVAVKKSVQRILAASNETAVQEKGIRIVQDDQGKPRVELVGRQGSKMADVSISHSNGLAMAAAAVPGAFVGFGVDVEKIEPRSDAWMNDYFTDEEIQLANASENKWAALTEMWSLKEAALKAMGTGLRFDLKDVQVANLDETGKARLKFRNEAGRHLESMAAKELEARVHEQEGLVFARVMIRK